MTCLTKNGRVFFGANGRVHELVFQGGENGVMKLLRPAAKKMVDKDYQQPSFMQKLIPFFGPPAQRVLEITIDQHRNTLYCLKENLSGSR